MTQNPYAFAQYTAPVAPAPAAPPRRGAGRTVALVLTVGLVAGGAGGLAGAAATDQDPQPPRAETDASEAVATSYDAASGDVADVAAQVLPSVVSIAVQGRQGSGSGSGVVLDEQGHVLTNNHVVEPGVGGAIEVQLSDGRTADAEIVGRDDVTDLAVLRVQGLDDLQPIQMGSSAEVTVGSAVIAVGSPLGLSGTVTTGIISALDRTVRTSPQTPLLGAIQTDAAINPGNSGGALVDADGRLIGINTAISTTGGGGSIGLGFAIPVDQARSVADELIRTGAASHPSLGVAAVSVDGDRSGALLQEVPQDSAAGQAGLRTGDLVVAVDDTAVDSVDELVLELRRRGVGQLVVVSYLRDGEERSTHVTLADRRA